MGDLKSFVNQTNPGNELAIKRGAVVPNGAVNLSYVKSPLLTPAKNIVIIDTSRIVDENQTDSQPTKKLMYANSLGILEDNSGNQLVEDEFPVVTDVFSIEEDWSVVPGDEYTVDSILPYMHTSRFFHVDFAGLTIGTGPDDYKTNVIKIVDGQGRLYVDDDGKPKFRIRIAPALYAHSGSTNQHAYRVFAYVDTDTNEDLYLTYNKVEIDNHGNFKNQQLSYKEILNPQPFFEQRLEESEVVDYFSKKKKWFATESLTLTEEALNMPTVNVNGYRIYVPRKALLDSRIFQTFRWRVSCTFKQDFQVQTEVGTPIRATEVVSGVRPEEVVTPITSGQVIRCGVVVTNQDQASYTPYALLNLQRSSYNRVHVAFQNPLQTDHSLRSQSNASYWYVNLDTISNTDLDKFDLLIWSPNKQTFDFSPYIQRIRYFTDTLGHTLYIDSNDYTVLNNLNISGSSPVAPSNGNVTQSAGNSFTSSLSMSATNIEVNDPTTDLVHASNFGGWEINVASVLATMTAIQRLYNPGYSQYIGTTAAFDAVLSGERADNFASEAATVWKQSNTTSSNQKRGNVIISTIGQLFACNALFSISGSPTLIHSNQSSSIYNVPNYNSYLNSGNVEGAMKFLFNVALLAVANKQLESIDIHEQITLTVGENISKITENQYSSSWTFASDWQSSWVVDGEVLTDLERGKYQFSFLPEDVNTPTPVWQRKLSDKTVDQLIESALTPDMKRRVAGATRNYVIEVTNSKVKVPVTLGPNSHPYAWTDAYSPVFRIPPDMGPNVVRETEIPAHYIDGQYTFRQYPNKPYNFQVRAVYDTNDQFLTTDTVHWTITGNATETITITKDHPAVTNTSTSEVGLTWGNAGSGDVHVETNLYPEFGVVVPTGLKTWSEDNYYSNAWGPGQLCWPYWGQNGLYFQGSSGPGVQLIQNAMNGFGRAGYFGMPYGILAEDGAYGSKTAATVLSFQRTFHARYLDGVVDAETWSIIGAQALRLGRNDGPFSWVWSWIRRQNISSYDYGNIYAKRSWVQRGPSFIWDVFAVTLGQNYSLHAVTVFPFAVNVGILVTGLDVLATAPDGIDLFNHNPNYMMYNNMRYRVDDGVAFRLDFSPREANTVLVGLAQDIPSFADSKVLGVRDIVIWAEVTTSNVTPAWTEIIKQTNSHNLTDSGTANVTTEFDVTIRPTVHYSGPGVLSNITWTGVSSDNSSVIAVLDVNGLLVLRNNLMNTYATSGFTVGPALPEDGNVYYSMDENGRMNPAPETGWISKADGIKLLCDVNKKPIGFPALPTGSAVNDAARAYTSFSITSYGTDSHVMLSFYDKNKQEFITDANGKPVLPYADYIARGPQNIYIGVISTFELDTTLPLPVSNDAPKIPFLACYPVYGVEKQSRSKITLEPLPPNLGVQDVWPVAVRVGEFDRTVTVRSRMEGPITTFLKDYQGTNVTGHYSIPEAQIGGWSLLYGYPNSDVVDETPIILDDNLLQVRQAPILMAHDPSVFASEADPLRPVLQVSHRNSIDGPWDDLGYEDLADWNVSTGEIYLKNPMSVDDPWLWKVTYTSEQRDYYLKRTEDGFLNLNPYPGHSRDLIGKPIHVYILPEYVKDQNGLLINGSLRDRTLRFSTSSDIFDPVKSDYDPLAIQLGVIYISTALDLTQLAILDSRRRGGGAKDASAIAEILRLVKDASTYWDVGYAAGMSYQKGGFIIIRLPAELKNDFTEQQIRDVIERNITSGVRYKIEDLTGVDWV